MDVEEQSIIYVGLDRLRAHPRNANEMDGAMREKLIGHVRRTGRYPPLIVRCLTEESAEGGSGSWPLYQVLDGHHRWAALERLGYERAACVVWEVDDAGALMLLGTLNRLRGRDDPWKRAAVIEGLRRRTGCDAAELGRRLPETGPQVRKYLALRGPAPAPAPPRPPAGMPVAVHFFLTGERKGRLDAALRRIGGGREEALMEMVDRTMAGEGDRS